MALTTRLNTELDDTKTKLLDAKEENKANDRAAFEKNVLLQSELDQAKKLAAQLQKTLDLHKQEHAQGSASLETELQELKVRCICMRAGHGVVATVTYTGGGGGSGAKKKRLCTEDRPPIRALLIIFILFSEEECSDVGGGGGQSEEPGLPSPPPPPAVTLSHGLHVLSRASKGSGGESGASAGRPGHPTWTPGAHRPPKLGFHGNP